MISLLLKSLATAMYGPAFRSVLIQDATTIENEINRVATKIDAQHNADGSHAAVTAASVNASSVILGGVQRSTWPAAGSATQSLSDVLMNGNIGTLPAGVSDAGFNDQAGNPLLRISAYGDVTAKGLSFSAISQAIHNGAVIKLILYDASKDSDGGAWRKRCQDKSWYTEALGGGAWLGQAATANAAWALPGAASGNYFQNTTDGKFYTLGISSPAVSEVLRGNTREFPEQVAIVAETGRVVIYDLTQAGCPMWMVFRCGAAYTGFLTWAGGAGTAVSSVAMAQGALAICTQYGAVIVSFASDTVRVAHTASYQLASSKKTSARNSVPTIIVGDGYVIASVAIVDVAMTTLDGAVIDSATGLPIPTIALATGSGTSVISSGGTVASSSVIQPQHIAFDGKYLFCDQTNNGSFTQFCDVTGLSGAWSWAIISVPFSFVPMATVGGQGMAASKGLSVNACSAGVAILKVNPGSLVKSMVAYITQSYNSGWLPGDVRGAWLADTVVETTTASGELVANGTFSSNTSGWILSPFGSWDAANTSIRHTGGVGGNYAAINTVPGKTYLVTLVASAAHSTTNVYSNAGTAPGSNNLASLNNPAPSGTTQSSFTAQGAISYITFGTTNTSAESNITTVSVMLADADRSAKQIGLLINGSLSKASVAAASQLVAYYGFSSVNYLSQPYTPNLDFGTGDFCVMGWLTENPNSAIEYLFNRDSATPGKAIRLWVNVAGCLVFELYDGTTTRTATGTLAIDDSMWRHVMCVYSAGTLTVYVNGVVYSTVSGAALLTMTNASAITRISYSVAGGNPLTNGSITLWRVSAYAPSADQIAYIYRTELPLFQSGTNCTLDGTSASVTAIAYDETSDVLHVGTPWGRNALRDLVRVESVATSVGSVTALSAGQGTHITGGASAGRYYQPAMLLRDELRRKEEARRALGKIPIFLDFDAVTSQVTFVLPNGYTAKAVYSAGALKRAGSTKDYVITSDGFAESVIFGIAPGNTVWISIMAIRN
jgi:hypothetical protein